MEIDGQLILNIVLGALGAMMTWILNRITHDIAELKRAMEARDAETKTLPLLYVLKTDQRDLMELLRGDINGLAGRLDKRLERIEENLPGRASRDRD